MIDTHGYHRLGFISKKVLQSIQKFKHSICLVFLNLMAASDTIIHQGIAVCVKVLGLFILFSPFLLHCYMMDCSSGISCHWSCHPGLSFVYSLNPSLNALIHQCINATSMTSMVFGLLGSLMMRHSQL